PDPSWPRSRLARCRSNWACRLLSEARDRRPPEQAFGQAREHLEGDPPPQSSNLQSKLSSDQCPLSDHYVLGHKRRFVNLFPALFRAPPMRLMIAPETPPGGPIDANLCCGRPGVSALFSRAAL